MAKIACICEGAAERAIIDILLDHDCLIFSRSDLLEEEILRCRSVNSFQKRYLNKSMDEKVSVYRIIDSRREQFNLTGPYRAKVSEVINVITAPEIEMLLVHAEDCYDKYEKSNMKPSEYMKKHFQSRNVKSYQFVREYFKDIERLKRAIGIYHSKTYDKSDTIYQLLLKKD